MELLGGKFKEGGNVQVDVDEDANKIIFDISEPSMQKKKKKKEEPADA